MSILKLEKCAVYRCVLAADGNKNPPFRPCFAGLLAFTAALIYVHPTLVDAGTTGTAYWTGHGSSGSWNDTGNWSDNNQPLGGSSSIVHFQGSTSLAPQNDYGNYTTLGQILFDSQAASFNLQGNVVELVSGSGSTKVENNSTTGQTISFSGPNNETLLAETSFELDPTIGNLTITNAVYADSGTDTLNVYGNTGHTLALNGGFKQYGQAVGQIVLQANSTVQMTVNSIYTGGTILNGGFLYANNNTTGSATGAGAVTVNTNATLAGNGTIGNTTGSVTITSGGTITAGADATHAGTLTTGQQAWNAGGTYVAKVDSTGANDLLIMAGLTPDSSGKFNVTLTGLTGSTYTNGQRFILADVKNGTNTTFSNVQAMFNFTTAGTAPTASHFTLGEQSDTTGNGGEDLIVTYADDATPEPTSAILLALAVGPLIVGRRRRSVAASR